NLTTSRAEGAHAILKIYLQVLVDNSDPQAQNKPFYMQVVTKVFIFALKKIYEQFLKASNTIPQNLLQPCSGAFKSSMERDRQQFESLQLHQKNIILKKMPDIFQESAITIQDPEVQPTRGCPVRMKNCSQSFTKRDPSTFELVMRKHRKCGICYRIRHNSRTCPSKKVKAMRVVKENIVYVVKSGIIVEHALMQKVRVVIVVKHARYKKNI
ncbi:11180_t:CDS:2, partial [Gigaspora margarita]